MSVQDIFDTTCTDCGNYNTNELICEDCIKERITKARADEREKWISLIKRNQLKIIYLKDIEIVEKAFKELK